MAPRKIAKTETVARARTPKSKEKPKLKTPTVVKVKLPFASIRRTVQNIETPNSNVLNKKSKDLTSNDKLELANSVARAQLVKSEPVVFPSELEPPSEPQKGVKVPRRRGRRKKIEEVANNSLDAMSNVQPESTTDMYTSFTDEINVEPPKRLVRRFQKTPIKPVEELPLKPEEEKAMTHSLGPKKKISRRPLKRKLVNCTDENKNPPKKKWTQSNITEMKIILRRNSKASSNSGSPRTVSVVKPKLVSERVLRGKKKADNTEESVQGSPSILTQDALVQETTYCVIKKENDDIDLKNACVINSRKTSVASELSWTKDISDSSNTTTVTSVSAGDFVRINRKLPEVKLIKIDTPVNVSLESRPKTPDIAPKTPEFTPKTPSDTCSSSSDSDSSDSESTINHDSCKASDVISRHSLNLSTSSESHRSPIITQKNISINTMNSNVNKIAKALDKLSLSLKKIDLEMINWVGYQNEDININGKNVRDKIYQNLKEESNIILQCRHINNILADNEEIRNDDANVTENLEDKNDDSFVKPNDVVVPKAVNKSSDYSNNDKGNHSRDKIDYNDSNSNLNNHFNDHFTSDNVAYKPFDQFDDEDALSLYAESIGFESNRNSISSPPLFNPEVEEYIPQPVTSNVLPSNKIVYNPTRINNAQNPTETVQNARSVATVCEKQNADSTSVVKETNQDVNRIDGIEKLPVPTVNVKPVDSQVNKAPCLLASIFKAAPGVKSIAFKGMCFFHLIGSCKNQLPCRFPHVTPSPTEITSKLTRLSENYFIQEYMLLKCWPGLRRMYGMCFVEECKRRDLTRLLVEMAIDFVMKANLNSQEDTVLKVNVMEEVLLYLNNVDLKTCEDLLKYVVLGSQLCDLFMETIANTQNFTRFKPVFIKLTEFMIENGKSFNIDVVSHILERVAILPFNDSLAWALISIIKHTDAVIFENSMMGQFEKQLSSNEGLLREFLTVKGMAGLNQPVMSQAYNPAPTGVRQEVEKTLTSPLYPDGVQRYTSPDTTHLDSMNKPPDEPIITRTINFDRSFPNLNSSSSESTDEYPRTPKPNSLFNSWRHKSVFQNLTPQTYPHKRRVDRHVTYGGSPSKYQRRCGPDFF